MNARAIEAIRTPEVADRYLAAYDALLQKWPVPYQSLQISTSFGSTHVIASGPADAPPLVLLHGLQVTALVWRSNVEGLSQHFRVCAVDVIGQGGKSLSGRRLRKRQQMADWLSEVFDALGIEQAAIAGNSFGGFLAMNQALLAPERVSQVIMINPAGVFVSVWPFALKMLWTMLLKTLRIPVKNPVADITKALGRDIPPESWDADWAALISLVYFNGEMTLNNIFPSVFSKAELQAIQQPVLLLMGDNDLIYDPAETLTVAQRRMPSLQGKMVPGAHHVAAMAKPEEVNKLILEFLQP